MLKKNEQFVAIFQRLVDVSLIAISWILAYYLRFRIIGNAQKGLEPIFLKLTPVLMILALYFFNKNGLYRSWRFKSRFSELATVFKSNAETIFAFILVLYFFAGDRISRMTLILFFLIAQVVLIFARIIVRNILRSLRRRGHNLRHILLVGSGEQLIPFVETIKNFKDAGINIIGWVDHGDLVDKFSIPKLDAPLDDLIKKHSPDTVIVGHRPADYLKVEELINKARLDLTPIQVLPHITHTFIGHQVEDFAGFPLLTLFQPSIGAFDHFLKRVLDFFGALFGLLLISPFLLLIAILVKITSKGPIFYGQERMGLDGESFLMWKFRSMRVDAEKETGAVWAVKNDDRRTPIGKFLRETSIDELPQLFNVLTGDMSLVGPRPERPVFVHKFKHEIPAYMLRHKMKAGITGWAQVNGWRGDTSLHKRIECDIYYIQNWSLLFDIQILFMTVFKGFINKNAY